MSDSLSQSEVLRSILRISGMFLFVALPSTCERLAIRTYTSADGLAHNAVHRMVQDSRGWLWMATSEGLSRFDGHQITSYGTQQGLADRKVNDLLVTSEGEYWAGTAGGLCRFDPKAQGRLFQCIVPKDPALRYINTLIEEQKGSILAGTEGGIVRFIRRSTGGPWTVDAPVAIDGAPDARVSAFLKDRQGYLWAGGVTGLYRMRPGAGLERPLSLGPALKDVILSLAEDREGVIWAGADAALYQIVPHGGNAEPELRHIYERNSGLPGVYVQSLLAASDGRLWMGTDSGLAVSTAASSAAPQTFRLYGTGNGLPSLAIEHLLEDREGNVWLSTDGAGAARLSRSRITEYDEGDGLSGHPVIGILEDSDGALCTIARSGTQLILSRFDGRRFVSKPLNLGSARNVGWGWSQIFVHDRSGEWWIATGAGLARFAPTSAARLPEVAPSRIYNSRDQLPGLSVFRVYQDQQGDIWGSTSVQTADGLFRWTRSTGAVRTYSERDGLPPQRGTLMASFLEDRAGNLWIGSLDAGLVRYRAGRFEVLGTTDGAPAGGVRTMLLDHAGRLWLGCSRSGLVRVDNPENGHPRFTTYSTAQGLSSNLVNTIAEDNWGRIYAGTGRGIDRLDVAAAPLRIRHFSPADGLPPVEVTVAFRSGQGDLWFGTQRGLIRLSPEPEAAEPVPADQVWILGVRGGGIPFPVSEVGERNVRGLSLAANRRQLQVDYGAVGIIGPTLYQYRLTGVDTDWSPPSSLRSVNYAGLPTGSHVFEVRTVASAAAPASIDVYVSPAIWERLWFQMLVAAIIGSAAYVAYRYRLAQLVAMERVRTRIAADLHDDIGASLSQIAILSDVVVRKLDGSTGTANELISQIASVSRELVDSMSDIVWTVNPHKDHLKDLTQRMLHFAGNTLAAKNVELHFDHTGADQDRPLSTEVRREVFLVFKEAVNNAARHSSCTKAAITVAVERGFLVLNVKDNGSGFERDSVSEGNGMGSMRERARRVGGAVSIQSSPRGTDVCLRVPLPK